MSRDADQQALQRAYYARTADMYEDLHWRAVDEHQFALSFFSGVIGLLGVKSVLDIGSGTGRSLRTLRTAHPDLRVVGVEPSAELREIGYAKGLSALELIDGNAMALDFEADAFDFVIETATLHHVPRPRQVVAEMLRVAKRGIFISDSNNYGQGSSGARAMKALIRAAGLWRAFDFVRTRGRGYMVSEGDGLYYSYSVFDDYPAIRRACRSVHLLNTVDGGVNPLSSSGQVALLALKQETFGS